MNPKFLYCLLLITGFFAGCGSKTDKNTSDKDGAYPTAVTVIVQPVKVTTLRSDILVSGNVEGNKTVRLGFMVAGRINHIISQEGQKVAKGQLVASLDPVSYSIARQQADIQVQQTTDEYNRLKIMYERNSISESDFRKISFGLQQAKAQQRLHAQNLAYTRLSSPIDGVILKTLAEAGEITPVGNPVLVIADINTVNVNAYIPENQLKSIRIGQEAQVDISALGKTVVGKVAEVGSAAEATSRAFTVKIKIPNPDHSIRPGMIAEVKLQDRSPKQGLAIPAEALLRDNGGESFVYVVDMSRKRAFKRRVSVGAMSENQIQVTSGLKEGDNIVTGGQHKLSDGALVSISK